MSIGTTLLALIILGLVQVRMQDTGSCDAPSTCQYNFHTRSFVSVRCLQGYMTKQNLLKNALFMFLIGGVSAISE